MSSVIDFNSKYAVAKKRKMKSLLVLATFFIASNALSTEFVDKFMAKVKDIGQQCIVEVSASEEDINSLMMHKVPASHEGKCLLFCFHKRFHIQSDDGSIDRTGAMQALDPLKAEDADVYDKTLKVFKSCEGTPVDSDPCVYAANLAECGVKEAKTVGLDQVLFAELE